MLLKLRYRTAHPWSAMEGAQLGVRWRYHNRVRVTEIARAAHQLAVEQKKSEAGVTNIVELQDCIYLAVIMVE